MPSPLTIEVHGTDALVRDLLLLGTEAPRAATRALNRTLGTTKTASVPALAEELGLRNKDITPSIRTERATFGRQIATLSVTGRRIPLLAFGARQTRRGVTYRLPGGRGLVPSGFIATMRSGHQGVFARRTKKRLPIIEQFGPSLPGAFVRARIDQQMLAMADAALQMNLAHEIEFIRSKSLPAGDGT